MPHDAPIAGTPDRVVARSRREGRLDRGYPGEPKGLGGMLTARLMRRDKPLRATRKALGQLKIRGEKIRKSRNVADPTPNAPLLIRIVLWPFVLDTVRGRRQGRRDPIPWDLVRRQRFEGATMIVAQEERRFQLGGPVRALPQRVVAREPRLPISAWLEGQGSTP